MGVRGTHFVGVFDHLGHVVFHHRVHDVEEIRSIGEPSCRKLAREVLHKLLVVFHVRPEGLDTEFVKRRAIDAFDCVERQELLGSAQHFSQEVLVPI